MEATGNPWFMGLVYDKWMECPKARLWYGPTCDQCWESYLYSLNPVIVNLISSLMQIWFPGWRTVGKPSIIFPITGMFLWNIDCWVHANGWGWQDSLGKLRADYLFILDHMVLIPERWVSICYWFRNFVHPQNPIRVSWMWKIWLLYYMDRFIGTQNSFHVKYNRMLFWLEAPLEHWLSIYKGFKVLVMLFAFNFMCIGSIVFWYLWVTYMVRHKLKVGVYGIV